MNKILKYVCVAITTTFLVACGPPREDISREDTANNLKNKVFLVTLEDGTRCAIFEYIQSGGISCDWAGTQQIIKIDQPIDFE